MWKCIVHMNTMREANLAGVDLNLLPALEAASARPEARRARPRLDATGSSRGAEQLSEPCTISRRALLNRRQLGAEPPGGEVPSIPSPAGGALHRGLVPAWSALWVNRDAILPAGDYGREDSG